MLRGNEKGSAKAWNRASVQASKRASKQAMKVINEGKTRENVHRSAQGRNKREELGVYHTLMQELRLHDREWFYR